MSQLNLYFVEMVSEKRLQDRCKAYKNAHFIDLQPPDFLKC